MTTTYKHIAMTELQYLALKHAKHALELDGFSQMLGLAVSGDDRVLDALRTFWPGPCLGELRPRRLRIHPWIAQTLHAMVRPRQKRGPRPTILGLDALLAR